MSGTYRQPNGVRIIDYDGTFFRGVKSDSDPNQLPIGYAWNLINMLNTGGALSCRPGYDCKLQLPDGKLQGARLFRPVTGLEQILFVVDGKLYVSRYPFTTYAQLPKIQFLPHAEQIFWEVVYQSAERTSSGLGSAIKLIPTKTFLFIQDGGFTAPAWFDGNDAEHIQGDPFGTPASSSMVWVGDRLWLAKRNQVFASDISNPFSFRESVYLGGNSSFYFSSEVTAMTKTPSIEAPQLMVLTAVDGSLLQANIRQRDLWPTTPEFQKEIVQVGCLSQRSLLSHYGQIVWFSPAGVSIFDPATSGKLTARLPARDNEMAISKSVLNDDLSLVSAASFGQFLLFSVPAEDQYNTHTWVLNHASYETLTDDSGPSWSGFWIGTRPVEWITGIVADSARIYHVSVDYDGKNRLWEAFNPNRLDNQCPITWAIESRGMFGQTAAIQEKSPGARCRFSWADIAFAGIAEDLNVGVFYAGGARGSFKQILSKKLQVQRGILAFDQIIDHNSVLFGYKPQSRVLRTEDANQQGPDASAASCPPETLENENIDTNFQLLIVGHGPATVQWIKAFALTVPEVLSGNPRACEDETGINGSRYDGVGVSSDNEQETSQALTAIPTQEFISSKTEFLESAGFTAAGTWVAESVISQMAAERVAEIVATKMADKELESLLPPAFSTVLPA